MTPVPVTLIFHRLRKTVYCCGALSLLLLLGQASWANDSVSGPVERLNEDIQRLASENQVYTPPPDSRLSRENHTGGGVRGCSEAIAALAPRLSVVGRTISTHPTFVWYVFGDDAANLEFHLYRYQADDTLEAIKIESIDQSRAGYMTYTLPSDEPPLQKGDTYLWQAVLYCDQNMEEVGSWTAAEIEIVGPPVSLAAGEPENSLQRAKAYARAGFWYDALAEVYDADNPEERAFRQNLLLDLANLEDQSLDAESEIDPSDQLRQIAEM